MGKRGYVGIGLHFPKNPINVGSVLRAADCFGADFIATSGKRYTRAPTDVGNAYQHIPLIQVDEDLSQIIPYNCIPIAIELVEGAQPLHTFTHPERAFYVFGPEDSSLGKEVLNWCQQVLYVPTSLALNLAACVNIVLYDRAAKRNEWPEPKGIRNRKELTHHG